MEMRAPPAAKAELNYQTGFGNSFSSEAVKGALPLAQNSPQKPPKGLYPEVISGTAFTAPRAENRSTWLYRMRPSASHGPYARIPSGLMRSGPFNEAEVPPNRLRWDPLPLPGKATDFLEGLVTMAGSGEPALQTGIAVHLYRASHSMEARYFWNADGELMFVPQQGSLLLFTELGQLAVQPGEIGVVPRGVKFRVEMEKPVRGYLCENYGAPFRLPELGPIGSNGLANARDFLAPVAAFEIVLGYVGAAATKSVLLGLIILATAAFFVPFSILHPLWMVTFMVLTAVTFSLFGFIVGIWAKNWEQMQLVPMLIVTPLTFLGGAFYSIDMLPPLWQKITLFNPVVYLISGFRWSFYGVADVNVAVSVAAILGFLALCLAVVWWIFRSGWKLKS